MNKETKHLKATFTIPVYAVCQVAFESDDLMDMNEAIETAKTNLLFKLERKFENLSLGGVNPEYVKFEFVDISGDDISKGE